MNDSAVIIKKEVCWAITNFAATGSEYSKYLLMNYPKVISNLLKMCSDNSFLVRKEAITALYNITLNLAIDNLSILVDQGLFNTFLKFFNEDNDNSILYMILKSLEFIFSKDEVEIENENYYYLKSKFVNKGGYDSLQKLIEHPNPEVSHFSNKLITDFHLDKINLNN